MSGHSKWANIKHRKEATDKKRARVFSKLLRAIAIAAKKDNNPESNSALRTAVERARKFNVPHDHIERALKKSDDASRSEELTLEAYGPEGVALIIRVTTDNKNRAVAEIKKILKDHDVKWAEPGSVMWAFEPDINEYEWRAKFPQHISKTAEEKLLAFMEALDNHDDVDEIYTSAALNER